MATAAHNSEGSLVGGRHSASASLRAHPYRPVHDDHIPDPPVQAAVHGGRLTVEQSKEYGQPEARARPHRSMNNEEVDHFAHAHGGQGHFREAHKELSFGHLFKKPIIRQWLLGGVLYKGQRGREATYVELFFDLMFVGIIHQLAEGAVEPISGKSVIRFILLFYPSWSVWSDVRNFINHSGVDDIIQRVYILVNMLLLLGYSAMASSIELEPVVPQAAVGKIEAVVAAVEAEHVNYHLADNFHSPLRAAVAFLLVAKLLRLLVYMVYAVVLPKFRISLCLSALLLLLPCAFWLPLAWAETQAVVVALASTAIGVELGSRYVVALVARVDRKRALFGGHTWFAPALSIEHMMDRTAAFIVLVLGESIINATFTVDPAGDFVGLSTEYGRAAMAIVIAFEFMWLYFDADSSRTFVHAMRRHWITSIMSTQLHWPLSAALVLVSAALHEMVSTFEVGHGLRWYFAGGISVALFTTALMGWLHLSLDEPGTSLLPRSFRLFIRVGVAVAFAVIPLAGDLPNLEYLGIHAGALGFLILIETFGKLGARPADYVFDGEVPAGKGGQWGRWGHGVAKEDLTDAETGEADVGVEGELGEIHTRRVQDHQRLAYTL